MKGFPKGTKELKKYTLTGVYILIHNEEVVYVGQALNIYARIHTHIAEGKKIFNTVKYIECAKEELDVKEYFTIRRFLPKYNIKHNDFNTMRLRHKQIASIDNGADLSIKEYIRRNNLK